MFIPAYFLSLRALSVHAKLWIKGKEAQPPSLWYRGLASILCIQPSIYILKSCLKFERTNTFGLRIDYDWDSNSSLLFLRAPQDDDF